MTFGAGLSCLLLTAASAFSGSDQAWRGIVKAVQQPTLTSELATPIAAIGFREGEHFAKGQVLIEFDCRRQRHEAVALEATVREARVLVETNTYLEKRGASNANDVEIARARHDKARAEHSALLQRLTACVVTAPFEGVVTQLVVSVHETPAPGRPLMSIASVEQLEIELIVPSRALPRLQPGTALTFLVDETASRQAVKVARLGGAVDPVSQTAKVYATFLASVPGILPGMSGTASAHAGDN